MQADLTSPPLAYLWDHCVGGKALCPGAAFFEMASAAAGMLLAPQGAALTAVSIPAPLVLPALASTQSKVPPTELMCKLDAVTGAIETLSSQRGVHLLATLAVVSPHDSLANSTSSDSSSITVSLSISIHQAIAQLLNSQRTLEAEPAAVADIDDVAQMAKDVTLPPAVLDCCLHLGALPAAAVGQLKVPAGIQAVCLPALLPSSGGDQLAAAALQQSSSPSASVIDYSLLSSAGAAACSISGLLAKTMAMPQQKPAAAAPVTGGMLYQMVWDAKHPAAAMPEPAVHPAGSLVAAMGTDHGATALCSVGLSAFQVAVAGGQHSMRLLTAAAQPQLSIVSVPGPAGADGKCGSLLWGMLRSVALEHSAAVADAVDADCLSPSPALARENAVLHLAAALPAASLAPDAYGAAVRGRLAYCATLQLSAAHSIQSAPILAAACGRVVVTGGMGSLGTVLAGWAEQASLAAELVLIGRTGRTAGGDAAAGLASLLAKSRTAVTLAMADVASSEGSSYALTPQAGHQALTALFHSGGVLADGTLANQAPAGVRSVFAPKVDAAHRWQRTLSAQPSTAEVLFSSVAALLGSGGQVNYSAANAALDAMAASHQQKVMQFLHSMPWKFCEIPSPHHACSLMHVLQGLLSSSVQWGAWAGGGMAVQDRSVAVRVRRMGMDMITAASGLQALEGLLSASAPTAVYTAVPFNWPTFLGRLGDAAVPPMFAAFVDQAAAVGKSRAASKLAPAAGAPRMPTRQVQPVVLQPQVAGAAAAAMEAFQQHVATEAASAARSILGTDISPSEPLMAAGLDSLSSVEFRNSLEARLGLELPSTLVFDYPSVNAIAQFVADNHGPSASDPSEGGGSSETLPAGAAPMDAEHLAYVGGVVADVARGILGGEVEDDAPLMSAGLDSLSSGRVQPLPCIGKHFSIRVTMRAYHPAFLLQWSSATAWSLGSDWSCPLRLCLITLLSVPSHAMSALSWRLPPAPPPLLASLTPPSCRP